jgi:hypothetical protein
VESIWVRDFADLFFCGGGCDFRGVRAFLFVVFGWWICGELMVDCGEFVVGVVVMNNVPRFGDLC